MKKEDVKVGMLAYHTEKWSGFVEEVEITELYDDYAKFNARGFVKPDGDDLFEGSNSYGTAGEKYEELFATPAEAYSHKENKRNNAIKKYRNEIKTVEDLISFPLKHAIGPAEEYTNHEAAEAYKMRASELLGIQFKQ